MAALTSPLSIEYRRLAAIEPYGRNARTHSKHQVEQIAASIRAFGFTNPILVDERGVIIAGHARFLAATELGLAEAPVIVLAGLTDAERRALVIADNQLALNAGWNAALLASELADLQMAEFDISLLGFSEDDLLRLSVDGQHAANRTNLFERFGVPPFSVLDARQGYWQDRKRAWLEIGMQSELGRGAAPGGAPMPLDRAAAAAASPDGSLMPAADYSNGKRGDGRGRAAL